MRFSWAQIVAGVLTSAVVAGLLLLPGHLLGPEQPVGVAVPLPQKALSVQAAPPLAVRHRRPQRAGSEHAAAKPALYARQAAPAVVRAAVTQPRTVVRTSPARRMLATHRTAVVTRLAPRAPLVPARRLAAVLAARPVATTRAPTATAKTIAALGAGLRKK